MVGFISLRVGNVGVKPVTIADFLSTCIAWSVKESFSGCVARTGLYQGEPQVPELVQVRVGRRGSWQGIFGRGAGSGRCGAGWVA